MTQPHGTPSQEEPGAESGPWSNPDWAVQIEDSDPESLAGDDVTFDVPGDEDGVSR